MRLGIIGSGLIVQEFLPEMVQMEGLDVVAIQGVPGYEEQIRKLCDDNGVPYALTDFEELCKLDIDTVYIAVPNFLHCSYCKDALNKGLNVIVEKPMTSNYKEAKELSDLARQKGLFIFEAVTTVYFEAFEKIREWLKEIGTIKNVNMNYCQYSRRYDEFRNGVTLPAFDPKKSGGALMDLGLYNLHFIMGLFGRPQAYRYYPNIERNIDTSGVMIMEYEGFKAMSVAAKDCSAPFYCAISGTDGNITIQYPANFIGKVTLTRNDGSTQEFEDGFAYKRLLPEFHAFISMINSNDHKACYERLDHSLEVSEVKTKARLEAGIFFPCDE
ncbi:MAG: Gfo/Idh/MocA family oxidoreductase [Erysipelotrichaceae bacterium]|nr:Gfo/Idh/MocA family oxidoreductase [Erysipelotrichaceae bacterium]